MVADRHTLGLLNPTTPKRRVVRMPNRLRPYQQNDVDFLVNARRFWAKVDVRGPDDCWPWTGGKPPTKQGGPGYGRVVFGGRRRKAHAVAWELSSGLDVGPTYILHSCDFPPCCNPAHLRPGTKRDNIHDAQARGRLPRQGHRTHCRLGHVLTEGNIYRLRSRSTLSGFVIACRTCNRTGARLRCHRKRIAA